MNFKIERQIESGVFSTVIKFISFGNEVMTAEQELKLFSEFGFPEIDLGGVFKGKLKVMDGKVVLSEDPDTEFISFILNSQKATVDDTFTSEFRIGLGQITSSEIGLILDADTKIAESKCLLFETEIIKRIDDAVQAIASKACGFSDGYPKELTL